MWIAITNDMIPRRRNVEQTMLSDVFRMVTALYGRNTDPQPYSLEPPHRLPYRTLYPELPPQWRDALFLSGIILGMQGVNSVNRN